jgi:hypothetical protein
MTDREKMWFDEYLKCWDATESARRASYKWPNKIGPRLKSKFSDKIKSHLEQHHMTAEEVLKRLADQARGNMARFVHVSNSDDVKALNGEAAIIKKLKRRKYIPKDGDPYEDMEIELYDAQSALQLIGKHHGLFDAGTSEDNPLVMKVIGLDGILQRAWGDNADDNSD